MLTKRQLEVLAVYGRTGSRKETATELGIAVGTVKTSLAQSYARLGVGTAAEAWSRLGWLQIPVLTSDSHMPRMAPAG